MLHCRTTGQASMPPRKMPRLTGSLVMQAQWHARPQGPLLWFHALTLGEHDSMLSDESERCSLLLSEHGPAQKQQLLQRLKTMQGPATAAGACGGQQQDRGKATTVPCRSSSGPHGMVTREEGMSRERHAWQFAHYVSATCPLLC